MPEARPEHDQADEDDARLDAEVALAAALVARDLESGPTAEIDLGTLTPTEKRALLALIRRHLDRDDSDEGNDEADDAPAGARP